MFCWMLWILNDWGVPALQLQPPGGGSPGGSAFAAAASAAFGSVSRASLDTWGSSLGAEGSESQVCATSSACLPPIRQPADRSLERCTACAAQEYPRGHIGP